VGSIENLPEELAGIADKITINFPWGSLLKFVVEPDKNDLEDFAGLYKKTEKKEVLIRFGYRSDLEPTEAARLNLPDLNLEYIENKILPQFAAAGFKDLTAKEISKEELRNTESSWGKKLGFGADRGFFEIYN